MPFTKGLLVNSTSPVMRKRHLPRPSALHAHCTFWWKDVPYGTCTSRLHAAFQVTLSRAAGTLLASCTLQLHCSLGRSAMPNAADGCCLLLQAGQRGTCDAGASNLGQQACCMCVKLCICSRQADMTQPHKG